MGILRTLLTSSKAEDYISIRLLSDALKYETNPFDTFNDHTTSNNS